jgi:hypothetical protein
VAALFDPEGAWSAARLAAEMQPYWDTHATIVTTPESRRPHLTLTTPGADGSLRVVQRLLDPAGDDDFAIEGRVDLAHHPSGDRAGLDGLPLVELVRIG